MKVCGLPVDPGPAGWNALLPDAAARASLKENIDADWLVVGAGFAGLSAARRLSELRAGERIVVLEASRVAHGPAGRNSGFMIDVPHDLSSADYGGNPEHDLRETRLNRAGIEYALNAASQYSMDDEAITLSGKVNGAITQRGVNHNDAYARHLHQLSEPFERLDARAMQQLTGCHSYIDGLYTPGTAMIQPALYIRNLAQGIESQNVVIHENSPVQQFERKGRGWIVRTPSGSVSTSCLILSVNGHVQSFGIYPKHLIHIYTYASMTQKLSKRQVETLGGEPRWALTPADPLGTTVRRVCGTGGDRLIIRNRATYDPSMKVDESRLKQIARTHDRSFLDRFPMLADVKMHYRWGGKLCLSRNNVSVFGEVDEGMYAACCQNGLGTAKGTVSGKLIAELACGQRSQLLDDLQQEADPVQLPPMPVARIGATAMLRWGEMRAGKEL